MPVTVDLTGDREPRGAAPVSGADGLALNAVAGLSLGALVGLLVGLSAVPVVASALGALLALLVTFFGFARPGGAWATRASAARVAGFGLAMAVALLGGVALRAHGALGPSYADRVARYAVQGQPRERALALAAYEHLGLRLGDLAQVAPPAAAPATSAYAFNGAGDPACSVLDARYFTDAQARLAAMRSRGGAWEVVARIGHGLSPEQAQALADAAFALRCGVPP